MARWGGRAAAVLLLTGLPAACSDGGDERVPLDAREPAGAESVLPAEFQPRVDSANLAYREGDYETALRLFQGITREAPDLAVGWYGLGMTHGALGDEAAADSAMGRAHGLAPELPMEHPAAGAPPNPHPAPVAPHGDDTPEDPSGG